MPVPSVRVRTYVRARKDEAQQEAKRLRDEGWSLAGIARELGVAKSSVSLWVRRPTVIASAEAWRPARAMPRRLPVWISGRVRRCGRCGHDLPPECFNRLGDGSAMVVPRHASPSTSGRAEICIVAIEGREARTAPSIARAGPRAPSPNAVRGLRGARPGRSGVRPRRGEGREHLARSSPTRRRSRQSMRRSRSARSCVRTAIGDGPPHAAGWRRGAVSGVRDTAYWIRTSGGTSYLVEILRRHPCVDCENAIRSSSSSTTSAQARARDATRVARMQPRHDRRGDPRVRDPLRELPSARDGHARRSLPLPGPKLCGAPVAQLVRAGGF